MEAAGEAGAALGRRQFDNQANRRLGRSAQVQPGVQDGLGGVEAGRQELQPGGLIPGHGQRVVHQQRGVAVCVIPAEVQSAKKGHSRHSFSSFTFYLSLFPLFFFGTI